MTALRDKQVPPLGEHSGFKALVVVGNAFTRKQIVRRFLSQGAHEVVEARTAAEARAYVAKEAPGHVFVIEAVLQHSLRIDLERELRLAGWVRGVVLDASRDEECVRHALRGGVRGYLVSGDADGSPASPRARPAARGLTSTTVGHGPEYLSSREIQVVSLVAEGRSNKQIGVALGLTPATIKSHLKRIGDKLETGDRAQIVFIALRAGLI